MIIWGWGKKVINLGLARIEYCPVCEKDRDYIVSVVYNYFEIFWIPLISWGAKYFYHCSICDRGVEINKSEIASALGKNPIPWWHRYGWAGIGGLIAVVVVIIIATSSTSQPAYTPIEGTQALTPNDDKYIEVYYTELLEIVTDYAEDIALQMKVNKSDKDAMSTLVDTLKERNIQAGLVSINSEMGAPGNLDYCVAAKTIDRDTVFLTILPHELELMDESERVQFVYLEKGKKIGMIPAKLSASNSYQWYEDYLSEIYEYYDYTEYLYEYSETVDQNNSRLNEIERANERIISYIEDPPLQYQYLSDAEYERVNREFDRFVDLANARIDRYNNEYIIQYNEQVADFNDEVALAEELADKYPNEIFYVEEYYLFDLPYPLIPLIHTPSLVVPYTLATVYTNVDDFLSALNNMISSDDVYDQIPKPDKSQFKFERVTDKNFTVSDFTINW